MSHKETLKAFFFDNPKALLRLRHIEKRTQLPFPSVSRYTKELHKEGYLETRELEKAVYYRANYTNDMYKAEKICYNLLKLHKSGLIKAIKEDLGPATPIILFGSCAYGEDVEESDIDIFIEAKRDPDIDKDHFQKILRKELHFFRHNALKSFEPVELRSNIANGIVVNGLVELY